MARWKLMTAHYINVAGTEWEYQETSRGGESIRKRFPVPRLLDPIDPKCWTSRWGTKDDAEGEVIVCHAGKGDPKDTVFTGDPTPDMMPLDDEAKEISGRFTERWKYKPDIDTQSFSQSMINKFEAQMADIQSKPQKVEVDGLADLVTAIGALVEQVTKPANPARRL